MFKLLFLLFKITGLSPSGSKFDSYLSATSFTVASVLSILAYRFYISIYLGTLQSIVFIVVTPFMFLSFLVPIAQTHFRKQLFFSINEGLTRTERLVAASCYYSEVFQFSMLTLMIALKFFEYHHLAHLSLDQNVVTVGVLYFCLVSSLQHTAVVRILHLRFSQLNHRLRAVAARQHTSSLSRLRADLRERLREHALLRRTVKHINSYFAFNTLCGFFTSLVFLIVEMYSVLLDVRNRPQVSKLMVVNMIQTAVLLLYKIDTCHRCSDQANEAVMIAHRMLHLDSPTELMDDVELFSLAQFKNPVALTAAGVFNLNRGLITKAGAASISYLIVAVQLKSVG